MEIDKEKIGNAALVLLYLTLDRDGHAWKGIDWEALNRFCARGSIGGPVGKAKPVWITEEGIARSERLPLTFPPGHSGFELNASFLQRCRPTPLLLRR